MSSRMCARPCLSHPACLPHAHTWTGSHPCIQPQISAGGKKKCSHSSLLSRARGGISSHFIYVCPFMQQSIHIHIGVCVHVYTQYTVSEALQHINCVSVWLQAVAIWSVLCWEHFQSSARKPACNCLS